MEPNVKRPGLAARLAGRLAGLAARFLGPGPGSLRGYVNAAELAKVLATAAVAGLGLPELLRLVIGELPKIVPASDLGLATAVLTAILEGLRRYRQGRTVVKTAPAPEPPRDVLQFPRSL